MSAFRQANQRAADKDAQAVSEADGEQRIAEVPAIEDARAARAHEASHQAGGRINSQDARACVADRGAGHVRVYGGLDEGVEGAMYQKERSDQPEPV